MYIVLTTIRFPLIPSSYLCDVVEKTDFLSRSKAAQDLLFEAYRYHAVGAEVKDATFAKPRRSSEGVTTFSPMSKDGSFATGTVNGVGSFIFHPKNLRDRAVRDEMTLDRVLQNQKALVDFLSFLEESGQQDLLLFWLDAEAYQNLSWKPVQIIVK